MTLLGSRADARAKAAHVGLLLLAFVFIACAPGCKDKEKATSPAPEDEPIAARAPRPPVTFRDASAPAAVATQDPCEPGLLRCTGACIDPATSNQHCGACGNSCFSGYACRQRHCEFICQANTKRCGPSCLDVRSDVRNCGGCGTSCFPDQVCSDGVCGCAKDKTACAGVCVEPLLGLCGVCGKDCPEDLPCDDGAAHAADWPTLAADMSRTGYNQGEHGTPPLSDGWAVSVTTDPLYAALVSGARVFVSGQTKYGGKGPLFALDLNTGATLWKYDFGAVSGVGQASVVNCRVYVQSSSNGGSFSSRVWSIRADTGESIWSRVVGSQWSNTWSPAVNAEGVYFIAQNGLSGASRKNGVQLFPGMGLTDSFSQWATAVHDPDLYTFAGGKLQRYNALRGTLIDTISVKWNSNTAGIVSTPVFSPEGIVYLIAPPTLYAFEAVSKRLLWSYGANISGMPALAEGRVLTLDSQLMTSFDAKTGAMQWRNLDVEGLVQTPVAAAGYAYAASKTTTYAFDLRDGSVAWSAKVSGSLSIGGGRLFVASEDGILHSYVLTQPPPAASPSARVH